ncbi:MAG: hypothetical protein NZ772_16235 [Cyanobacteria bacterium]|nr:hypothetical protein [Cyanobacteriota bacterium]MDW8199847.1 hypothetical protein [Cyanobacteriota bacterium SKYGB_h_bin112]
MKLLRKVQSFFPQASCDSADPADVLITIVRNVANIDGFRFEQFCYYLDVYQTTRTMVLSRKPNSQSEIDNLRDYCDVVRFCLEGFRSTTVEMLCREIEALFSRQQQRMVAA